MKCKKYVWSVVPLVLVCVLLAANSVGGGANAQAPASQPPCIPHAPGLVSWWPGDTNAQDVIGGNDGTLQNGATAGVALGKVGHAFSLDGMSAFVDVGNRGNLKVSGGDFSVVAWVRFTTLNGNMSIVDKMSGADVNQDGWRLLKQDNHGEHHFEFCLGSGIGFDGCVTVANNMVLSNNTVVTAGTFYHVAAVKTSSTIKIYVDGMPDGTTTPLGTFIDSNAANLLIGKTASTVAPAFLDGQVDEVEIYNRALTDAEIYSIYKAGTAGQCKMVQWDIISLNNGSVGLGGLARADANDGSLIEFSGHGTFVLGDPDNVPGGGNWKIEKEIAGVLTILAHGKYEVETVVRFVEAPGAFPTARTDNIFVGHEGDARAGLAVFRIRYADGSPGILVVSCRLHGTPRNVFEVIAASKGAAGYFDPEEPVAGVDMNRTLFHIVVQ